MKRRGVALTIPFNPSYYSNQLFNYNKFYGHNGKSPFHGTYDKERYYKFMEEVKAFNISEQEWPYLHIEDDFYSFNSYGYRTYEFDEVREGEFDLAIGCSYVEGLGVRQNELWIHHYEQMAGVKVINLGKGGGSNTSTKYSLMSWLSGEFPKPRKIIILWTEPSRETFVRESGSYVSLNPGWPRVHQMFHSSDSVINTLYQTSLQDSVIWCNRFIDVFSTCNVVAKSLNIPLYNFFPNFFWSETDVQRTEQQTSFSGHVLNFDNVVGGWRKFGTMNFYPAADGIHHGFQHQLPLAQDIYRMTHEEN